MMDRLAERLGPGPFALVALFVSPEGDFPAICQEARARFPGAEIVACTTAGEIGAKGYLEGAVAAIGLPASHFAAQTLAIEALDRIDSEDLIHRLVRSRTALAGLAPSWSEEFAFLAIDGLSVREDTTVSAISAGLGPVPLFGGSAGDGARFEATYVSLNGKVMRDAAVLALIRTDCQVEVFSLNHLQPADTRMVVTGADPARRIVRELNAEPAAREYARVLGKNAEDLDTFTFAAHPVVVRLGETHHVRAIQRVLDSGEMVFFSAIDEGIVLRLAAPDDLVDHLGRELDRMTGGRDPAALWICDCILRRVEAEQKQRVHEMSRLLASRRAVGFSTYGEQIGSMHVNQTMTGVAIYPPRHLP
ncbi:GfdT protein [Rhodobacterales bacterium HKCCE2091]|nr:GfdT protein [Rhodobacterales bacterium HKCCE2091]